MPLRTPAATAAVSDLPTGWVAQNYERRGFMNAQTLVSGRMVLSAIYLRAGTVVTNLIFYSNTTALVTGTHGWAALYDPSLNLLGQSADDAAITWAASSEKVFTLVAPVTVSAAGWYYTGLMVAATTPPTITGVAPSLPVGQKAPVMGFMSTTGLTTTAPTPAATSSSTTITLYSGVS